jgi:hypothetical protein
MKPCFFFSIQKNSRNTRHRYSNLSQHGNFISFYWEEEAGNLHQNQTGTQVDQCKPVILFLRKPSQSNTIFNTLSYTRHYTPTKDEYCILSGPSWLTTPVSSAYPSSRPLRTKARRHTQAGRTHGEVAHQIPHEAGKLYNGRKESEDRAMEL